MADANRSVRLSAQQAEYLAQATYLPPQLREAVAAATGAHGARRIDLDPETADAFRSAFTERLAQVGFDADYDLTEEGAILEELIDLFAGEST